MEAYSEKSTLIPPKNKRQKECVLHWGMCVGLRCKYHFCMSLHHYIISHNITSYIILHQWHKKGIQCWSSENASKKWNCAKAQNKFWRNTTSSALMWRKKSIVDEALMFLWRLENVLRSIKALLYEAWKEGKVFFAAGSKTVCTKKFHASQRTELQTIHILHSSL